MKSKAVLKRAWYRCMKLLRTAPNYNKTTFDCNRKGKMTPPPPPRTTKWFGFCWLCQTLQGLTVAIDEVKQDLASVKQDLATVKVELTAAIDEVKQDLATVKQDLATVKDEVKQISATLIAPEGNKFAEDCTVKIISTDSVTGHKSVMGHGLLMHKDGTYHLVSAAHVLIDVMYFKNRNRWTLEWSTIVITIGESAKLFLPKSYVENGSCDIGCLTMLIPKTLNMSYYNLNFCEDTEVTLGSIVVGRGTIPVGYGTIPVVHGTMLLKGNIHAIDSDTKRILLDSYSTAGCSGSPLFNNNTQLIALLHGETKHRGKGHSTNGDISSYVYADRVYADIDLYSVVDTDVIKDLLCAENIPEKIQNNPTLSMEEIKTEFRMQEFSNGLFDRIENSQKSLITIMAELAARMGHDGTKLLQDSQIVEFE